MRVKMIKEQKRVGKAKEQAGMKEKVSVGFEINPYYEQLLEMREKKPAAYRVMSSATRLAVEAYVKAKEAASHQNTTRAAA
jgi:hypothetical protein